ncbi:MAG: 16S rRNA (cytosine(1402)-N(4))-methyltransferase RsmH [Planctomycetota bacterium]
MSEWEGVHEPVMKDECLQHLAPERGRLFLDGTIGIGGHAVEIARQMSSEAALLGIDRDQDALELARARLLETGKNFELAHTTFDRFTDAIRETGRAPESAVDGMLLDLGVSSLQLDRAERGFSFRGDGPLDMRMDSSGGTSAEEYLRDVSETELARALRTYGEEKAARRIAGAIVRHRANERISTTGELAAIVESVSPRAGQRLHPATRTFQAIRIVVNGELERLEAALRDVDRFMAPGGRVVVLSYHSLEDRIVKQQLGRGVKEGLFRWAFGGVERPSEAEVERNPRSRSARLRVAIRAGGE